MSIPKKIKIGDQEVELKSNPELLNLVEAVRKEEKEKQHTEILGLKKALADKDVSETKLAELQKRLEEVEVAKKATEEELIVIKAAKKDLEETKKSEVGTKTEEIKTDEGKKGEQDLSLLIEGALTKFGQKMTEDLEKRFKNYETELEGLKNHTKTTTVESHKQKLITKYDGLIIPDLLTGNTIEEVDKSLAKALEISKKYITVSDDSGSKKTLEEIEQARKELEKKQQEEKGKQVVISVSDFAKLSEEGKAHTPPIPPDPAKVHEEIKNINEMSSEEFAKNKEYYKKQLRAELTGKK